jgi:hypothetical protein
MTQPGRPEITSARPLFGPKQKPTLARKGHGRSLSDIVLLIAWWKIGLEDRFQHQHCCCHADSIAQG